MKGKLMVLKKITTKVCLLVIKRTNIYKNNNFYESYKSSLINSHYFYSETNNISFKKVYIFFIVSFAHIKEYIQYNKILIIWNLLLTFTCYLNRNNLLCFVIMHVIIGNEWVWENVVRIVCNGGEYAGIILSIGLYSYGSKIL